MVDVASHSALENDLKEDILRLNLERQLARLGEAHRVCLVVTDAVPFVGTLTVFWSNLRLLFFIMHDGGGIVTRVNIS